MEENEELIEFFGKFLFFEFLFLLFHRKVFFQFHDVKNTITKCGCTSLVVYVHWTNKFIRFSLGLVQWEEGIHSRSNESIKTNMNAFCYKNIIKIISQNLVKVVK